MTAHEEDLRHIAAYALKRHGTPEKALAGFEMVGIAAAAPDVFTVRL